MHTIPKFLNKRRLELLSKGQRTSARGSGHKPGTISFDGATVTLAHASHSVIGVTFVIDFLIEALPQVQRLNPNCIWRLLIWLNNRWFLFDNLFLDHCCEFSLGLIIKQSFLNLLIINWFDSTFAKLLEQV